MTRHYFSTYPNRTLCGVLEEMRKCNETRNYTGLIGLIEEAQSMANRMEAGLSDKNDVEELQKQKRELTKECKALAAKVKVATDE